MIDPNMVNPQQLEEELKVIRKTLAKILDKKAMERLANIRLVKPELAVQLELYLYQLYQTGQLDHVTDEQMKSILQQLNKKPEFKIRWK
ncbi:MAG: hypothetical protein J7L43_02095 [Candidatus Aenigmarchaeota archaeon]|nr:hypothetical protein [Candidatus Aenigmarchaeota archaeon]